MDDDPGVARLMARVIVKSDAREAAVETRADGHVTVEAENGGDVTIEPVGIAGGAYRVSLNDRSRRVYVAGPPERRWVFCDGRVYALEVDTGGRGRNPSASVPHESLSAPMPATVIRIAVQEGETVVRGQTLLMLEAMKMELPIRAPHDGVIERIHCREGELVQPGAPLLEFV